ncbi:MAG: DUF362 domain-containing protein [Oscillospiraceae bacterium]|nr:DUF362 domain-containing protein [Oscillospiraceae bacterium]
MKNVYFKPIKDYSDKDLINKTTYEMLKNIIEKENISLEKTTPLKVHFGERGNDTFITPENYDGIKKYLKEKGINTCYIETNVLYKGSRTHTKDHIETAKEHGFTDLDIVIADGDSDNAYEDVEINKEFFKKCKIGYKFRNYNSYIVLAHFKGHENAGLGGAVKQLGMGFASRGGKLNQHSNSIPVVTDKCTACGICKENCPVNAITIDSKSIIDPNICIGCAECSTVCPFSAITNNWGANNFFERLAEHAYAAAKGKTNIYFNFAFNITKGCDCMGVHMESVAPNMGIFVSSDPVAIDTACIDTLQKITNSKLFDKARATLNHAEKIGLGTQEYNIIEM